MQLFQAIHKKFKLASVTKARTMIKSGFVLVNGAIVVRPDTEITLTDDLQLVEHSARRQQRVPFDLLYEDASILVACKPAGILVEDFVKKIRNYTPVILTHRLDQKVSGVMIFAKSGSIEKQLEANWNSFEKLYVALVEGKPAKAEGRIESFLAENKELKVYSTVEGPDAKLAITHYKLLKRERRDVYRLEVRLETGRKNQIRVHLSDMGCPIVGDIKYGAKTAMKGRIALHAEKLSFYHPVSRERMTFTKEAPF
ncbi:MAG: RluA family pseudouridine synthase [Myxococcaceae bacterium]